MKSHQSYSLEHHNTFALPSACPAIYFPSSIDELKVLCQKIKAPFYVLGEGSNTLFLDETTPTIIQPSFKGIDVTERQDSIAITIGCGENWHQLVTYCVENNYGGLENLALIPGSVGAAPVQNIGAYGVELADVIEQVSWFEFDSQQVHYFDKQASQFAYRDSIFKKALFGKGIIVDITISLPKVWQPRLSYAGLDQFDDNVSIRDVYQKVIAIRQAKLPDPKQLPNCGSFFKNPVVSVEQYEILQSTYGEMPAYPQSNSTIKLAAGWLIEKAGYKGFREDNVGVHELQALVLVNYGSDKGRDIANLARTVQQAVLQKFSIELEVEVRLVSSEGLVLLSDQQSSIKN